MAAPPEVTTLDLSGIFVMNKTLSDETYHILELQNVSWAKRNLIYYSTITLYAKHYKDDDGVEHVDIDQTLSGIPASSENRTLDWTVREKEDPTFGHVVSQTRRIKVEEVEDDFLKRNWLPDTHEHGVVQSLVESDTPKSKLTWKAEQIWGFEDIDGERRYVRHVLFTHPNETIRARLVFDYTGPVVDAAVEP